MKKLIENIKVYSYKGFVFFTCYIFLLGTVAPAQQAQNPKDQIREIKATNLNDLKKDTQYQLWLRAPKQYAASVNQPGETITAIVDSIGKNKTKPAKLLNLYGSITSIVPSTKDKNKKDVTITWDKNDFNTGAYQTKFSLDTNQMITSKIVMAAYLQLNDKNKDKNKSKSDTKESSAANTSTNSSSSSSSSGNKGLTAASLSSPGLDSASDSGGSGSNSNNNGGSGSNGSNNSGTNNGNGTNNTDPGTNNNTASTPQQVLCSPNFNFGSNTVDILAKTGNSACIKVTTVPMEITKSDCSIRIDIQSETATVTEKKRYTYNGASNDVTGCYDTKPTFALYKEKADCKDSVNQQTLAVVHYLKYYYLQNGNKTYVSACMEQDSKSLVDKSDIRTEDAGYYDDFSNKTSYKMIQSYVMVDGTKYLIGDPTKSTSYAQKLQRGQCSSYQVNRNLVPPVVYEQKQWGFTSEDNVYHPVTPCAPDNTVNYPVSLTDNQCEVSVDVNARTYTLFKREIYTASSGEQVTITPCFATNDTSAILQSDIIQDYSCADYVDLPNLVVYPQYKEVFKKNGQSYELKGCDYSPNGVTWRINKSTDGCTPTVDYVSKTVTFKSQLSYNKNGSEESVTQCKPDSSIASAPVLEDSLGCVNKLSPDRLNFIMFTNKYYLDNGVNKVSLQTCTQRLANPIVAITAADKQKDYDVCKPGLTFPMVNGRQVIGTYADINGKQLTPYYKEYVVLGSDKQYLQDACQADKGTVPYTAILEQNSCQYTTIYQGAANGGVPTFDSKTPVGEVKPKYDVSYIDSNGVKQLLIPCLQTDDKYLIYQDFASCEPVPAGQGKYVKTRKFYFNDNIGNRTYLTNSCQLSSDERVAQEEFCPAPSSPFVIDQGSNLVYYNTRMVYYDYDNQTNQQVAHEIKPCGRSFNKAIVSINNNQSCGFLHNDATRLSELYKMATFNYKGVPTTILDPNLNAPVQNIRNNDATGMFLISNNNVGGWIKLDSTPSIGGAPLGNLNSVKQTTGFGIDATDAVSNFMNSYCVATGINYPYSKTSSLVLDSNVDSNYYFPANYDYTNYYNNFTNTLSLNGIAKKSVYPETLVNNVVLNSNGVSINVGNTTLPPTGLKYSISCTQDELFSRVNGFGGRVSIRRKYDYAATILPNKNINLTKVLSAGNWGNGFGSNIGFDTYKNVLTVAPTASLFNPKHSSYSYGIAYYTGGRTCNREHDCTGSDYDITFYNAVIDYISYDITTTIKDCNEYEIFIKSFKTAFVETYVDYIGLKYNVYDDNLNKVSGQNINALKDADLLDYSVTDTLVPSP